MKPHHHNALAAEKAELFTPYTFRHTCLTRRATFMDPHTQDPIPAYYNA